MYSSAILAVSAVHFVLIEYSLKQTALGQRSHIILLGRSRMRAAGTQVSFSLRQHGTFRFICISFCALGARKTK
jgi:hypothetical protein